MYDTILNQKFAVDLSFGYKFIKAKFYDDF